MLDVLAALYLHLIKFFESLFLSDSLKSSSMGPALLDKLNYFGWLGAGSCTPPKEEKKNATRALPSNWYTSKQMYELERRSIFSRKWQLITHKARLTQPGDWVKFDVAGFQIVICRDRQSNINAFHNVSGHGAFPIVEGQSGNNINGFEKELLPVHVHLDVNNFIWVNLHGGAKPEIAWEDDFKGIDTQERYKEFNFADYQFDHTWQMEGDYNWKILADNYNECYHCATTHPDIVEVANLEAYSVDTSGTGKIIHNPGTTEEQAAAGMTVASTYYFPNVSTNITKPFFMVQRFVPTGPKSSIMHYQVFRNKHASEHEFQQLNQIYKRIMSEDKYLCDQAQKNLNAGVFINGEMHPRLEQGPLHVQSCVRDEVTAHARREKLGGAEISPALVS